MQERRHVITVRGRLSERFTATFEGLTLEAGHGVTTLNGLFHDQAQLYGVLERVADCVSNSPESKKTSPRTAERIEVLQTSESLRTTGPPDDYAQ